MPFRCGKTTMARLLGGCADAVFKEVSATIASAVEVRSIFEEARNELQLTGRFVIMSIINTAVLIYLLGEQLCFSMKFIASVVRSRFFHLTSSLHLFLTFIPGHVRSFHRTGFCAGKQLE
jgi:hypothetical protein